MEQALYDSIGVEYNSTRRADSFLTKSFFSFLSPQNKGNYLDVGCGTGNYTIALDSPGDYSFYGVEPSKVMLEAAKQKSSTVFWVNAVAEDLPFEDGFFDGALASLTIHHWKNLEKGFAEIYRSLKKGCTFVIFTSFPEQMETYWLNYYFPQMMKDSMTVMPGRQKVTAALNSAGFAVVNEEKYFIQHDLQDLFLYSGKHRPSLYFDEQVRKGISSFSALSNREEVKKGLQKLKSDLENEDFTEIARNYESKSLGDYVFIVAAKPL
jgi:ubiquinone/menaquinone biosynthesis C-methylase UbiE